MPITPKEVLTDPKFQALSAEQRMAVLTRIDPNFSRLTPEQRQQVVGFNAQARSATPGPPATAVDAMFPQGGTVGVPKSRGGLEGAEDLLSTLRTRLSQSAQSGVGQGVGDFMTSLPQGVLRILRGQIHAVPRPGEGGATPTRAYEGVKDMAGGALEASQIPASFVAPEASELGHVKPIGTLQAAKELTNAINPEAQDLSRVQRSLTENLDKVLAFAKQKGINLDSLEGLHEAMRGAGNWIREHYYESLLGPFREHPVDLAQVKGYSGETASPSTATLDQLDQRLSQINAELDPAYRKASELAGKAAVKSEAELNAEAAYIRKALYGRLGQLTGLGEKTVADTRKAFGALNKLAETTEGAANKTRAAANSRALEPLTVNPLSNTKAFVGDKALAKLQGDPVANAIRKVVGRAKVPEYELPSPKATGGLPVRRAAPVRGESTPVGKVKTPTPEEAQALVTKLSQRQESVLRSRNKTLRRPIWEGLPENEPAGSVPSSSRGAKQTGTEAGAARETNILAKVRTEHPEWTLSQQLMEAAKRAKETGQ